MPTEDDLHRVLEGFGPRERAILQRAQYFEQEEYPVWEDLSKQVRLSITQESIAKNRKAWEVTWGLLVKPSLEAAISVADKGAWPWIEEYHRDRGMECVKWMTRVDIEATKRYMVANAGVNERVLARDFLKDPHFAYVFDNERYRVARIKRTESNRAASYGSFMNAKDLDFTKKTWKTAGDKRVRSSHRAQNGTTVKIDEKFPNGEEYPSQSSVGCRCHLTYS